MRIKNFGLDAPRDEQMMQRILADIDRRGPLPALDLRFHKTSMQLPMGHGRIAYVPTLSCHAGPDEAFHAAIIDHNVSDEELTVLLTHTNGNDVGFKSTYFAKPQAAVFVSFDILQFFFERVPHLNVLLEGTEDVYVPNPLFHKKLEVENALKAAYPELPPEYTWKANLEAKKPDNQPIVGKFE